MGAFPHIDEGDRVTPVDGDPDTWQAGCGDTFSDGYAGAVVSPVRVARADHDDARHCHRLVTRRSRKWVAQEMQGS